MHTHRNKLNRSLIFLFALTVTTLVVLSLTLVPAMTGATPSLAAGPQQEVETVTFPQSGSAGEDVPPINAEVSKIIDLSWNELAFEIQRGGLSNTALNQCGDTYEPDDTYTTAGPITVNGAA